MSLMMEGKRECRCGAVIDADILAMVEHIQTELHNERLRTMGYVPHTHSWHWQDAEGRPVDATAPGAIAYRKAGCPACEAGE